MNKRFLLIPAVLVAVMMMVPVSSVSAAEGLNAHPNFCFEIKDIKEGTNTDSLIKGMSEAVGIKSPDDLGRILGLPAAMLIIGSDKVDFVKGTFKLSGNGVKMAVKNAENSSVVMSLDIKNTYTLRTKNSVDNLGGMLSDYRDVFSALMIVSDKDALRPASIGKIPAGTDMAVTNTMKGDVLFTKVGNAITMKLKMDGNMSVTAANNTGTSNYKFDVDIVARETAKHTLGDAASGKTMMLEKFGFTTDFTRSIGNSTQSAKITPSSMTSLVSTMTTDEYNLGDILEPFMISNAPGLTNETYENLNSFAGGAISEKGVDIDRMVNSVFEANERKAPMYSYVFPAAIFVAGAVLFAVIALRKP